MGLSSFQFCIKDITFTVELTVLRSVRQIDLPDYPSSFEHPFHGLLDLIFPTTILPLKMLLSVGPASSQLQACPLPLDLSHPLQVSLFTPGCSPSASPFYLQPSLHPHCRLMVKGAGALKRKQGHMCNLVHSDKCVLSYVCAHCVRWVCSHHALRLFHWQQLPRDRTGCVPQGAEISS